MSAGSSVALSALTEAQPRKSWKWLDATSCTVDDPGSVPWLNTSTQDSSRQQEDQKKKISKQIRDEIMRLVLDRNAKETFLYRHIEQAVDSSTWVKKAAMLMLRYGCGFDDM